MEYKKKRKICGNEQCFDMKNRPTNIQKAFKQPETEWKIPVTYETS